MPDDYNNPGAGTARPGPNELESKRRQLAGTVKRLDQALLTANKGVESMGKEMEKTTKTVSSMSDSMKQAVTEISKSSSRASKTIANQTLQSQKDRDKMINAELDKVSKSATESAGKVSQAVSDGSEKMANKLGEVATATESSGQNVAQLSEVFDEGSTQMADNVAELSDLSSQNLDTMKESSKMMEMLNQSTVHLHKHSSTLLGSVAWAGAHAAKFAAWDAPKAVLKAPGKAAGGAYRMTGLPQHQMAMYESIMEERGAQKSNFAKLLSMGLGGGLVGDVGMQLGWSAMMKPFGGKKGDKEAQKRMMFERQSAVDAAFSASGKAGSTLRNIFQGYSTKDKGGNALRMAPSPEMEKQFEMLGDQINEGVPENLGTRLVEAQDEQTKMVAEGQKAGRKLSPEHRAAIAASMKQYWSDVEAGKIKRTKQPFGPKEMAPGDLGDVGEFMGLPTGELLTTLRQIRDQLNEQAEAFTISLVGGRAGGLLPKTKKGRILKRYIDSDEPRGTAKAISDAFADQFSRFGGAMTSQFQSLAPRRILGYLMPWYGAGYRSDLPDPKKDGIFGAMLKTMGLIYVSSRYAAKENNEMLYQIGEFIRIGFGLSGKMKMPGGRGFGERLALSIKSKISAQWESLMEQEKLGKTMSEIHGLSKEQLEIDEAKYIAEHKGGTPIERAGLEMNKAILKALVKGFGLKDVTIPSFAKAMRKPYQVTQTGVMEAHKGEIISAPDQAQIKPVEAQPVEAKPKPQGIFGKMMGGLGGLLGGFSFFKTIKDWVVGLPEKIGTQVTKALDSEFGNQVRGFYYLIKDYLFDKDKGKLRFIVNLGSTLNDYIIKPITTLIFGGIAGGEKKGLLWSIDNFLGKRYDQIKGAFFDNKDTFWDAAQSRIIGLGPIIKKSFKKGIGTTIDGVKEAIHEVSVSLDVARDWIKWAGEGSTTKGIGLFIKRKLIDPIVIPLSTFLVGSAKLGKDGLFGALNKSVTLVKDTFGSISGSFKDAMGKDGIIEKVRTLFFDKKSGLLGKIENTMTNAMNRVNAFLLGPIKGSIQGIVQGILPEWFRTGLKSFTEWIVDYSIKPMITAGRILGDATLGSLDGYKTQLAAEASGLGVETNEMGIQKKFEVYKKTLRQEMEKSSGGAGLGIDADRLAFMLMPGYLEGAPEFAKTMASYTAAGAAGKEYLSPNLASAAQKGVDYYQQMQFLLPSTIMSILGGMWGGAKRGVGSAVKGEFSLSGIKEGTKEMGGAMFAPIISLFGQAGGDAKAFKSLVEQKLAEGDPEVIKALTTWSAAEAKSTKKVASKSLKEQSTSAKKGVGELIDIVMERGATKRDAMPGSVSVGGAVTVSEIPEAHIPLVDGKLPIDLKLTKPLVADDYDPVVQRLDTIIMLMTGEATVRKVVSKSASIIGTLTLLPLKIAGAIIKKIGSSFKNVTTGIFSGIGRIFRKKDPDELAEEEELEKKRQVGLGTILKSAINAGFQGMGAGFKMLGNSIKYGFAATAWGLKQVKNAVVFTAKKTWGAFKKLGSGIKTVVMAPFKKLGAWWGGVKERITSALDPIKAIKGKMEGKLKDTFLGELIGMGPKGEEIRTKYGPKKRWMLLKQIAEEQWTLGSKTFNLLQMAHAKADPKIASLKIKRWRGGMAGLVKGKVSGLFGEIFGNLKKRLLGGGAAGGMGGGLMSGILGTLMKSVMPVLLAGAAGAVLGTAINKYLVAPWVDEAVAKRDKEVREKQEKSMKALGPAARKAAAKGGPGAVAEQQAKMAISMGQTKVGTMALEERFGSGMRDASLISATEEEELHKEAAFFSQYSSKEITDLYQTFSYPTIAWYEGNEAYGKRRAASFKRYVKRRATPLSESDRAFEASRVMSKIAQAPDMKGTATIVEPEKKKGIQIPKGAQKGHYLSLLAKGGDKQAAEELKELRGNMTWKSHEQIPGTIDPDSYAAGGPIQKVLTKTGFIKAHAGEYVFTRAEAGELVGQTAELNNTMEAVGAAILPGGREALAKMKAGDEIGARKAAMSGQAILAGSLQNMSDQQTAGLTMVMNTASNVVSANTATNVANSGGGGAGSADVDYKLDQLFAANFV